MHKKPLLLLVSFLFAAALQNVLFSQIASSLATEGALTRTFHNFRDEEVAKADEGRQAKKLDDGCMYTYCPSLSSSLTQHLSDFPASAVERNEMFGLIITANNYCQFLNATAAADPEHLYEERMNSSFSNLILRTGEVGEYHYQIDAQKAETPVPLLSKRQATSYCNWLQDSSLILASSTSSTACDAELQSTSSYFYMIQNAAEHSIQESSGAEEKSYLEKIVIEAAGVGLLLFAGREVMTRTLYPEQASHLPTSSSRLRLLEPASTVEQEQVPQEHQVSASLRLQHLPEPILRKAVFFSPESPGELSDKYGEEYQKALTGIQSKNLRLAKELTSWQEMYNRYHSLSAETGSVKIFSHASLQAIEASFPPGAHALTAFYRAGTVMHQFHSLQEKWLQLLKNQEEQKLPYLLPPVIKINDILAQAMTNIKMLSKIAQTCGKKGEQEEIQAVPLITEKYRQVANWAMEAIDAYTFLTEKIETKDPNVIRSFLQEREQRQNMIMAKPALCDVLLNYHREIEDIKLSLANKKHSDREYGSFFEKVQSSLDRAFKTTSPEAQVLFETAANYALLETKEMAKKGSIDKKERLKKATMYATHAGVSFEEERTQGKTAQGKRLSQQALDYYLQLAQEVAENGETKKAEYLNMAVFCLKDAIKKFEAAKITTSQGMKALDQALKYELEGAQEVVEKGESDKATYLQLAASDLRNANALFEQAGKVTTPQGREAFDLALNYEFRRAQERVIFGKWTDTMKNLKAAATAAREAGTLFEEMHHALLPATETLLGRAGEYRLRQAEKIADNGRATDHALNLGKAALAAREAGRALEKNSAQFRDIDNATLGDELQRIEEIATHGVTQKPSMIIRERASEVL